MDQGRISLTLIWKSLHDRNSSDTDGAQLLSTADTTQLDRTLKKILRHLKTPIDHWPCHRLLRCLIYIFRHARRESLVSLKSFRHCILFALSQLSSESLATLAPEPNDTVLTVKASAKLIYDLLEYLGRFRPDSGSAAGAILMDLKQRQRISVILHGTLCPNMDVRHYCLCALLAGTSFFATELLEADAFIVLAKLVNDCCDKLDGSNEEQNGRWLDYIALACRIWERLIKAGRRTQLENFAKTAHVQLLLRVWITLCQMRTSRTESAKIARVVYVVTGVVVRYLSVSPTAASAAATLDRQRYWLPVLAAELRCILLNRPKTDIAVSHAILLTRAAIHCIDVNPSGPSKHIILCQIAYDVTNFLTLYLLDVTKPEEIVGVGNDALVSSEAVDELTRENIYGKQGADMEQNSSLLVSLLECFMRHVQQARSSFIESISKRVAWCVKTMMAILEQDQLLASSSLCPRLERLTVFFLHYTPAIDEFSQSAITVIDNIWKPTISNAQKGLQAAVESMNDADPTRIQKAKQALVSLERATQITRACERLVSVGILDLVSMDLVPQHSMENLPTPTQIMYVLYIRLMAALAEKMAFARTKMIDEYPLIPLTIRFGVEAIVHHRPSSKDAWISMLIGSLSVINAFRSDMDLLFQWISWKPMAPHDIPALARLPRVDGTRYPLLSVLLAVIMPWDTASNATNIYTDDMNVIQASWYEEYECMTAGAAVLGQMAVVSEFGRQFMVNDSAMMDMSKLILALASEFDVYADEESRTIPVVDSLSEPTNKMAGDSPLDTIQDILEQESGSVDRLTPGKNRSMEARLCYERLYRAIFRIVHDMGNVQVLIRQDIITTLFRPLLACTQSDCIAPLNVWRRKQFEGLFADRQDCFVRVFETSRGTDEAIRLNELSAIAVCYATNKLQWKQVLGVHRGSGIAYASVPFGILCHMLIYDLEYLPTSEDQDESKVPLQGHQASQYRRQAAAQAIEFMAQACEPTWRQHRHSLVDQMETKCREWKPLNVMDTTSAVASFLTDDSDEPILLDTTVLRQHSPMFDAMLSEQYAETPSAPIRLGDVRRSSLEKLYAVAQSLSQHGPLHPLSDQTTWQDMIDLLGVSDRFCCPGVNMLCEAWIIQTLSSTVSASCIDGCLQLFRHCRDPTSSAGGLESTSWPFATMLHECLKIVLLHLTTVCASDTFMDMKASQSPDELGAFCDGLGLLLSNAVSPSVDS